MCLLSGDCPLHVMIGSDINDMMARIGQRGGILAVVVVGLLLAGCGTDAGSVGTDAPRYVTTIPPFKMILDRLVDGRGTVKQLLPPGASPHTYAPTPSDLRATTNATALVFGAEHLDGWTADLPTSRRVALLDLVPPNARLFLEDGGHGAGNTIDPHFWTDPLAVKQLLPAMVDTLCAMDDAGCATYRANADSFTTALVALDARLRTLTAPVRNTPVLLAKPFFRYFLRRYGPRLTGIIEPRPGAEPTPRQLHEIVVRTRNEGARAILTQQSLSDRAARAVSDASALPRISLDPIGGIEGRRTYEALLLHNGEILRASLGRRSE